MAGENVGFCPLHLVHATEEQISNFMSLQERVLTKLVDCKKLYKTWII